MLLGSSAALVSAATGPQYLGEKAPLVPPFCEDFEFTGAASPQDEFVRLFQVIDANNDGRSWNFYNYSDGDRLSRCAYLLANTERSESDDWLIPRAVKLQAGKYYCVHLDAKLFYGANPSTFEVRYGLFNDPEGMDITAIPATVVTDKYDSRYEGWICPEFDALYYIGVHSISSAFLENLMVDNISVDAPVEGTSPSGVTGVTFTNDPGGSKALAIQFKAPSTDMDGNPLQSIDRITVSCGGVEVTEFSTVHPGEELSFTDTSDVEGNVVYTFTPYNASGQGRPVHLKQYKGISTPMPPVITSFSEIDGGKARLTWTVPSTDINGSVLDPSKLIFNIYQIDNDDTPYWAGEVDGNTTEFDIEFPVWDGAQILGMAMLSATFGDKESDVVTTDYLCIGAPYQLPYHNSFTYDDYLSYIMEMKSDGSDVRWIMLDDHSDPTAQDGDNGYICMSGNAPAQWAELVTGKIDMGDADHAVIEFYTYVYSGDENELHIIVYDMDNGDSVEISSICMDEFSRVGWNRISVPVEGFGGKTIRVGLKGVIVTDGYMPIDNFTLRPMPAVDLGVGRVISPSISGAGERFEVIASIVNEGSATSPEAEVVLLRDGVVVASSPVPTLEPRKSVDVILYDTFNSITSDMPEMQVLVAVEGDGNKANDSSEPFLIVFDAPVHPAVTDLTGVFDDGSVTLTWSEPDLTNIAPSPETETFEQYAPYATSLEGWTLVDADQGVIVGFPNFPIAAIDNTSFAYFVADSDEIPFMTAVSGKRSLATLYTRTVLSSGSYGSIPNDDWLITPPLYGGRQTVRFHAASVQDTYGYETFETYWSDGSTDPEDFVLLSGNTEAPMEWTEYYATLPVGAKYFAIRCTSDDVLAFQLDDITYIPEGDGGSIELIGYNIYRDGELLNESPVRERVFTAERLSDDDRFVVTAVYDLGESVASNVVTITTGIGSVGADASAGECEYFNLQGVKVSADSLVPGIYICRRGNSVTKIAIR